MYMYMIIGMDYHIQQVPLHCRVCGQRLTTYRAKQTTSYECKAFLVDLQIGLNVDTSGDDVSIHPERFCLRCKRSMDRSISAIKEGLHHKCTVVLFWWQKHDDLECKVRTVHMFCVCMYTQDIMVMVHRYVSTSVLVQVEVDNARGQQLAAEVVRQG